MGNVCMRSGLGRYGNMSPHQALTSKSIHRRETSSGQGREQHEKMGHHILLATKPVGSAYCHPPGHDQWPPPLPELLAQALGWLDLLATLMPDTVKLEVSSYFLIVALVALWMLRRHPPPGA
jgi:hypothetical protein